jgi:hypothetical protein
MCCGRCIGPRRTYGRRTTSSLTRTPRCLAWIRADLEIRRDDALADLDRLRGELSATIAGHRATGRDGERAAKEPAKA